MEMTERFLQSLKGYRRERSYIIRSNASNIVLGLGDAGNRILELNKINGKY